MRIKELVVRGDKVILEEWSIEEVLDEYHKRIDARDAKKPITR